MKKEKGAELAFGPNEAPVKRWVLFYVLVYLGAYVGNVPPVILKMFWSCEGVWTWVPALVTTLLGFSFSLAIAAWLSRKVVKTTLKELILGAGRKVDLRQCGRIALAVVAGFVLSYVVDIMVLNPGKTALSTVGALPVIVNFIICLALVWMQTTWEEVLFRCVFLRATCGNNIRPTFKCLAWGVFATVLFMSGHFSNPEVTSQTDTLMLVLGCISYFISGFGMYLADVVYGSCMPGCVIHWANNFILFTVINQSGSALDSGALFYSSASQNGAASFIGTLLLYVPIAALLIHDWRKMHRTA